MTEAQKAFTMISPTLIYIAFTTIAIISGVGLVALAAWGLAE